MVLFTVYCWPAAVLHCAKIMQNYGAAFSSGLRWFFVAKMKMKQSKNAKLDNSKQ